VTALIGVWKVVPLAASPISVQTIDLPDGPDSAQNHCVGELALGVPAVQVGAVVPVHVTLAQVGDMFNTTEPFPGVLETEYVPASVHWAAAPVPGEP
jgi:hypothetical protein